MYSVRPLTSINISFPEEDGERGVNTSCPGLGSIDHWDLELALDHLPCPHHLDFIHCLMVSCDKVRHGLDIRSNNMKMQTSCSTDATWNRFA